MHICVFAYIEFMHLTIIYEKNDFESLNKKGEKAFETYVYFMHVSLS